MCASIMQTFCRPFTAPTRSREPRRRKDSGFFEAARWNVRFTEQSFRWNCWKNVISWAESTTRNTPRRIESWNGAQIRWYSSILSNTCDCTSPVFLSA